MESILDDDTYVYGHIYVITNKLTNKQYIGQTVTHRKNRNKYRPFGYVGRFNDHMSEAICNTKKKQCTYLNNAIRSYGKEAFEVELLLVCPREDLDRHEEEYISQYNTMYPHGYNLTKGGKVFKIVTSNECLPVQNPPRKRGGSTQRSQETRLKMSKRLKEICGTTEAKERQMVRSQMQHYASKVARFKGVTIDLSSLDQYLHIRTSKDGSKYIRIMVDGKSTAFVGKYETLDVLKQKAIEFLQSIHSSATLPNCSGNP